MGVATLILSAPLNLRSSSFVFVCGHFAATMANRRRTTGDILDDDGAGSQVCKLCAHLERGVILVPSRAQECRQTGARRRWCERRASSARVRSHPIAAASWPVARAPLGKGRGRRAGALRAPSRVRAPLAATCSHLRLASSLHRQKAPPAGQLRARPAPLSHLIKRKTGRPL